MSLTVTQARQQIVTLARSQVGIPLDQRRKYGIWYGWPGMLWCAAGASWVFHHVPGELDAKKVIGVEPGAPNGVGWGFTVAWRDWLIANGTKVSPANAQSGDLAFYKYETEGNRNNNVVNHVDLVISNTPSQSRFRVVGFNSAIGAADPSTGGQVVEHDVTYNWAALVDIYRPNWSALPTPPPPPKEEISVTAEANIIREIRERTTARLNPGQRAALATNREAWSFPDLFAVLAHRIGWLFQRSTVTREVLTQLVRDLAALRGAHDAQTEVLLSAIAEASTGQEIDVKTLTAKLQDATTKGVAEALDSRDIQVVLRALDQDDATTQED